MVGAEVAAGVGGLDDHGFTRDRGGGEGESVRYTISISGRRDDDGKTYL